VFMMILDLVQWINTSNTSVFSIWCTFRNHIVMWNVSIAITHTVSEISLVYKIFQTQMLKDPFIYICIYFKNFYIFSVFCSMLYSCCFVCCRLETQKKQCEYMLCLVLFSFSNNRYNNLNNVDIFILPFISFFHF